MEFHNVGLLPKGLPEIISTVMPYEIYPDAKVVAYHRKGMMGPGPMQHLGECLGYAGYDRITDSDFIGLYPTNCCSGGGRGGGYPGTESFKLWIGMLSTALHEIGHLATYDLCSHLTHHEPDENYDRHLYVEKTADRWMNQTMARILRDNPRLGQPLGALTGYPGALVYKIRNCGRPWAADTYSITRITEWRALGCDGQISMTDVANKIHSTVALLQDYWRAEEKDRASFYGKVYRIIHKSATFLDIKRVFVNKNGRCYRMFNVGEADLVYRYALDSYMVELQEAARVLRRKAESILVSDSQ